MIRDVFLRLEQQANTILVLSSNYNSIQDNIKLLSAFHFPTMISYFSWKSKSILYQFFESFPIFANKRSPISTVNRNSEYTDKKINRNKSDLNNMQ